MVMNCKLFLKYKLQSEHFPLKLTNFLILLFEILMAFFLCYNIPFQVTIGQGGPWLLWEGNRHLVGGFGHIIFGHIIYIYIYIYMYIYIYIYIYIHMCVCAYIHDRFKIFVVLLLLAFCSQSPWNIVVTLTSLCFPWFHLRMIIPKICYVFHYCRNSMNWENGLRNAVYIGSLIPPIEAWWGFTK